MQESKTPEAVKPETVKSEIVKPETVKIIKPFTKRTKSMGVYSPMIITYKLPISIINIGSNIQETLEKSIAFMIEGKCATEGYIKPDSVKIKTYSSGELNGSDVLFEVVIECLVCNPVENMHIHCVATHITESAGIKAEIKDGTEVSPVIIYIARDHHYNNKRFGQVEVGDKIKVRVIGTRFELNDEYVSIIAELI